MTVQCMYSLANLHRLFSVHKFESDKEGVGSIIPFTEPSKGMLAWSRLNKFKENPLNFIVFLQLYKLLL